MSKPTQSAFPHVNGPGQNGLDMRDWFAGRIAPSVMEIMARSSTLSGYSASSVAEHAYKFADAMMAEREKSK